VCLEKRRKYWKSFASLAFSMKARLLKFGSLKAAKKVKKNKKTFKKLLTKSEKILYTPFCSLHNFYKFLADDI